MKLNAWNAGIIATTLFSGAAIGQDSLTVQDTSPQFTAVMGTRIDGSALVSVKVKDVEACGQLAAIHSRMATTVVSCFDGTGEMVAAFSCARQRTCEGLPIPKY